MMILRFGVRYWDARDIWSTQTTILYCLQVSKEQEELVTRRQEDEGRDREALIPIAPFFFYF